MSTSPHPGGVRDVTLRGSAVSDGHPPPGGLLPWPAFRSRVPRTLRNGAVAWNRRRRLAAACEPVPAVGHNPAVLSAYERVRDPETAPRPGPRPGHTREVRSRWSPRRHESDAHGVWAPDSGRRARAWRRRHAPRGAAPGRHRPVHPDGAGRGDSRTDARRPHTSTDAQGADMRAVLGDAWLREWMQVVAVEDVRSRLDAAMVPAARASGTDARCRRHGPARSGRGLAGGGGGACASCALPEGAERVACALLGPPVRPARWVVARPDEGPHRVRGRASGGGALRAPVRVSATAASSGSG